jgi:hypothetical protein
VDVAVVEPDQKAERRPACPRAVLYAQPPQSEIKTACCRASSGTGSHRARSPAP